MSFEAPKNNLIVTILPQYLYTFDTQTNYMKKLYTLFAIVLIGFIGNAQIINFPDANFKAKLIALGIDSSGDGEIQQSEALQVENLNIDNSNISDLTGVEYFTNLWDLSAGHNQLTSFSLNGLQITYLNLDSNNLTSVDLSGPNSLTGAYLNNNHISSFVINQAPNLWNLWCENNDLTTIDLSTCPFLQEVFLSNNQLTSIIFPTTFIDFPIIPRGYELDGNLFESLTVPNVETYFNCSNNPNLKYLNLKEGILDPDPLSRDFSGNYTFSNCPQLEYVCVQDIDINAAQQSIANYGYTNCHVNTYCTFNPGGTYYTINGNNTFDNNNNGCDSNDIDYPHLTFGMSDGVTNETFINDGSGSYILPVEEGNYTVTPSFENPGYFSVSPTSASVSFPVTASPFLQDFCITANGVHNDLEVNLFPLNGATPGFDCRYKIIYKNKGTQTQSGTVSLDYFDPIEDLVSAIPNFTSESSSFMHTLNWSFSNLRPFESREIVITFNLNSPTETPSVNAGNLIQHTARIVGLTDETPDDNTSLLTQSVVNSYDPNDKVCTEGNVLPIHEVGKYLHYIIRFENTGTGNAENVVVKDMIDTSKFDISTLVPLHGSHAFETRISSTNKVEFIFENINLPFDNANNDGYVAFKIKTLPNLAVGNQIINSASIYFDYNAPIITDPYTVTVFNPLSTVDFDFGSIFILSPVPAKDSLTITTKQNVVMSSVNIYNALGQLIQVNTNPSETIDVSGLKTGSFFIKIISDKGTASSKFAKE
jgi:hypothetical protein